MSLDSVLAKLPSARRYGNTWKALCPVHEDKDPSLSIDVRGGTILVHCHASCSQEAVLAALGIEARELFVQNDDTEQKGRKRKIIATYDYTDEKGNILYQIVRYDPKDFRQRKPDGDGWTWKLDGVRRVLYHLQDVLRHNEIIVTEGEKDADSGRKMELCATTSAGGADAPWLPQYTEALRGKHVVIVADADEPGRKKARIIARALSGTTTSVRLLEMPGAKDLSEWMEKGGTRERFLALTNSAPEWKPEIVDGAKMLDHVSAHIRRFVSLSQAQAQVITVWAVHTHAFDGADSTPYLAVTSAEKQSGKTRLLEVLEALVVNPWLTGRVTAAVLTRKIDADVPTLLLDESDAAFNGEKEYAEALRGVLNTGHRRGGKASCCVGQGASISFRDFSTFCPKVIAGIGKLPDTVADRAFQIRLKRAARGEGIERFRRRNIESEAAKLKVQIETWCSEILPSLRDARPPLPEELTDRQQDGAEPLLAIADAAGGDWPQALRQSLIAICTDAQAADSSLGVQLLNDILQIFETRSVDRLSSADLVAALAEIETSPWAECSHGKAITANRLARLLKPYEIKPYTIRESQKTAKGYLRADFSDAWTRYLRSPFVDQNSPKNPTSPFSIADGNSQKALFTPSHTVTSVTLPVFNEIQPNQSVTEARSVTDHFGPNPLEAKDVTDVTVSRPGEEKKRVVEAEI